MPWLAGCCGSGTGTVFPPSGVTVMGPCCCWGTGAGAGAFFAGAFFAGAGAPSSTVVAKPALRVARIESVIDVMMKTTNEIVVAFESKVAEPRGPNAVCEPIPPKAPARSAALPLCSNTTMIKKRQTNT